MKLLKFGPGFLSANSLNYRLEYAFLALLLLATLHWFYLHGQLDLPQAVFFALLPDIAFIPMLPYMKGGKWPDWGVWLYNFTHSFIVFGLAFMFFFTTDSALPIALLAYALHLSADRALGLALRAKN